MIFIKNGYVMDPKSGYSGFCNLLIENGKIIQMGADVTCTEEKVQVIDAQGLLIAPGLVDVHVHFRDPGFLYKEDIYTGARAAARGGFTSVVLMANTKPSVDNPDTLAYVRNKGAETDIHVYSCANVTVGMQGKTLTDMEELAKLGAVGFTDDGIPIMDSALLKEAFSRAAKLDLPVSLHEEDPSLITNNGINRGRASAYFGIAGSPREAEYTLVERDLELAKQTGVHVNIQHISTKEAVEMVRCAKAAGFSGIHAEATPHHIYFNEDAVIQYGTLAKMNPPLREETDRQAIIKGLADGTIDLIATDHAPHSAEEKQKELTQAPSGIIGLETAFCVCMDTLVGGGYLSLMELIRKMSTNPAKLYHLDAGYLAENGPADLIFIDTQKEQTFEKYLSKSNNSPFTGLCFRGRIVKTMCGGKFVYEEGKTDETESN